MSRNEIKKIIKKYAKILTDNGFVFSEIYLFGSYADKKNNDDSDLDIAVVKDGDIGNWDEKMKLWRLAGRVDSRIEPLLLNKKDLNENATIMANEINKTGLRIL